jgi:nucleoside 2-deoxyribosyltransferase
VEQKKVVYIAGPITGVREYYKAFERAEDDLAGLGYIPLSPARLPEGMTREQYMRICFAMIDAADAVLFLLRSDTCQGAMLEYSYCSYTDKPIVYQRAGVWGHLLSDREQAEYMRRDLEEVLKK